MVKLIVVAHPDDEVLALGGSAENLGGASEVHTCIMSAHAELRRERPKITELLDDMRRAHKIAGMTPSHLGTFPNIRMNTVPHVELVQFIEKAIIETGATEIYTHHPRDLNDDHKHVSSACQAAVRLFQRRSEVPKLTGFYFIEVPSSTEWAFNVDGSIFRPTGFVEIGEEGLARKLEAIEAYRKVMRDFPHPRSVEVIRGLAALRGAQAGVRFAEALQIAFKRMN